MNLLKAFSDFKSRTAPSEIAPGRIYSLRGSAAALYLACCSRVPFIAATKDETGALALKKDIDLFLRLAGRAIAGGVAVLPEPDGADTAGRRALVSFNSAAGKNKMPSVISSVAALEAPAWGPEDVAKKSMRLSFPGSFPRAELEDRLALLGYKPVSLVTLPGQYRLKGWILDIYPVTSDSPARIEFFGDDVDAIRYFDVESQMHTDSAASITILPAIEPEDGLSFLLQAGLKNYGLHTLEDLAFPKDFAGEFEKDGVTLSSAPIKGEGMDSGVSPLAGLGILHSERRDITELSIAIKRLKGESDVLLVFSSQGQAERIKNILWDDGLHVPVLAPEEVKDYPGWLAITTGGLSRGFALPGLVIATDRDLFGEKPAWRPMHKSKLQGLVESVEDLSAGDYVVHSDHGIGRFLGFAKHGADGPAFDLLVIEYAGGDKIYLPVYGMEKIHKYRGAAEAGKKGAKAEAAHAAPAPPVLDRIGGKVWQKKKDRAKKRLKEMAGVLLKTYAAREIATGFAFSADTDIHREFDSFFQYEETPDQLKSINQIKADMEKERPMDRLLCGDVGYGKTEVAMRAAFKCVYDARQAVVLVPTTLLCEQHFRTFQKRFQAFPVKVDYVSRFKNQAEKKKTYEAFEKGETDILIGTHSLLKSPLGFANVGLLIIDEEHRFGVAHKEKVKSLKKNVDVLSMTATPIPRTLQMALSGIRDMSVIETPPEDRLAVKTTVAAFDKNLIKDAMEKELARGGQVFFVHNRIDTLTKLFETVAKLLPSARIAIAHGQMAERELERAMLSFLDGKADVLLSTAIIGAGLDIPNANTIIVDRADMMGLADLYQLKGRVGRGPARAYAFFLVPGLDIITGDAQKRLQALEEISYIGAGFRIAMKDLEIRGAGNLLGAEQSGYINDLGLELYLEMLERTVAELKGEEVKETALPQVELSAHALIPEEYLEDISLRLSFYRRIAGAVDSADLERIGQEMAERFGPLPEEVANLLVIMELRLSAARLGIARIDQISGRVKLALEKDTSPPVQALLKAYGDRIKFNPGGFDVFISERRLFEEIKGVFSVMSAMN